MTIRVRNDVTCGALPILMQPLLGILDSTEAGEIRAYYYETLMATLEAFEREMERERRRMYPLGFSEN